MRPSLKRVFQVGLCLVIIIWPLTLAYRSQSFKEIEVIEDEVRSEAGRTYVQVGAGGNVTLDAAARSGLTSATAAADKLELKGLEPAEAKGKLEGTAPVKEVKEEGGMDNLQLNEDEDRELLDAIVDYGAAALKNLTSVTNQTGSNGTEQETVSPSSSGAATGNASKIVDQIYVVNIPRCVTRWKWIQSVADRLGLPVLRWEATSWQDIDFENPPLPLEVDWSTQAGNTLKVRRFWPGTGERATCRESVGITGLSDAGQLSGPSSLRSCLTDITSFGNCCLR